MSTAPVKIKNVAALIFCEIQKRIYIVSLKDVDDSENDQ